MDKFIEQNFPSTARALSKNRLGQLGGEGIIENCYFTPTLKAAECREPYTGAGKS